MEHSGNESSDNNDDSQYWRDQPTMVDRFRVAPLSDESSILMKQGMTKREEKKKDDENNSG